ncbi:MAG: DegV family protein [Chloroflexi bacterium]|nr:DegV family protein [Chloroflexota bacterium]
MSNKTKVAVVVDSTAYIPEELISKYKLHVIPLHVNWAGESLRDNVDIKPDEFYTRLTQAKDMPTTSQPSAGEFFDLYSQIAQTAESIVSIHISAELSGTIASAHAAAELMGDFPIEIVDSRSTSMGLGYLALAAAEAAAQGADYKTAAAAARAILPRLRLVFVVDTLEYLHRGGRIGGAQRLFGSMLSIKPLLQLEDGRIEPLDKVRTKSKAVQRLIEIAAESVQGARATHVTILNAAVPAEAESLAAQIRERIKPASLNIVEISPVIGTHTGPAALGLAWYTEP